MKKNLDSDSSSLFPLMFEVGRAMRQAVVKRGAWPVPLAYLETLRFVGEQKAPTMRDIAEYLRIAAPSATAIIEELAAKGYLSRRADPRDRRVVRLALAKKGKALLLKSMKFRMETLRAFVAPLSAADKRALARILSKLVKK